MLLVSAAKTGGHCTVTENSRMGTPGAAYLVSTVASPSNSDEKQTALPALQPGWSLDSNYKVDVKGGPAEVWASVSLRHHPNFHDRLATVLQAAKLTEEQIGSESGGLRKQEWLKWGEPSPAL